jgi:hypothetical protein
MPWRRLRILAAAVLLSGYGTAWAGSGAENEEDDFGRVVEAGYCTSVEALLLTRVEQLELAQMIEELEMIQVRYERLLVELRASRAEIEECHREKDEVFADVGFLKAKEQPWLQRNFGWCVGPSVTIDMIDQDVTAGLSLVWGKKGLRFD